MKSVLREHRADIALLIGNGVNLFGPSRQTNSWYDLLVQLAARHLPSALRDIPDGMSLTEFYDVLDLKSVDTGSPVSLQREFCDLMASWQFHAHHERIVQWAQQAGRPLLTTNFEQVLSDAGGCSLYRSGSRAFTDFYPWESYYGNGQITRPADAFGIWHVNGMQRYSRSIRLGLSHYMGSVQRARGMIHRGGRTSLYQRRNTGDWDGRHSWLHILFNCPLLIFGLGLEENEVFLRWLLIERARYFKAYPRRKKEAWYVHTGAIGNPGKAFFLEGVGVTPLKVDGYRDIYGAETWR